MTRGYDEDGWTQPGDLYIGIVTTVDGVVEPAERRFPFGFVAGDGPAPVPFRPATRHHDTGRRP
jgi:hypothetical protein